MSYGIEGIFMATKSGIKLADGEEIIIELEAELYATSPNPIAQAIGDIKKIFDRLLGNKRKSYLVVTNKRVIEVYDRIACYCFKIGRHVKYVMPNSVKEIGFTRRASCGLFCPVYYLYYDAHTQFTSIQLKGAGEEEATKAANAFYSAISGLKI